MSQQSSKLYPYEAADSGKRFSIRKVSYNLGEDVKRSMGPAPEPPIVEVRIGGDGPTGVTQREYNRADPDYLKALQAYNLAYTERLNKLVVARGVVVELSEADKQEVADLRSEMDAMGAPITGNDKEVWLWRIAITTPEDYKDLINAILRRTLPTAEGVAAARERFRTDGEVPSGDGSNV